MASQDANEYMSESAHILSETILVTGILMSLAALIGLVGNLILLRSLFLYRNLRINLYVVLGGLALADMLHLVLAVPSHILSMLSGEVQQTQAWCRASRYIMNATSYISAYHLVVLCVLRGIMLTNRGNTNPTGRHTFYCSVLVWLIGILATVPVIQIWTSYGPCYMEDGVDMKKEIWLSSSFACFVPIGIIILIYSTTYYIGKRYFADSYSRHEKQMSRLVSVVVITFVFCEVPSCVVSILMTSNRGYNTPSMWTVQDYTLCLLLFDKALRPVLYSKLSSDLGECFDEVINCHFCHKYYSDSPKPVFNTQCSRAPLTNDGAIDACCEEIV